MILAIDRLDELEGVTLTADLAMEAIEDNRSEDYRAAVVALHTHAAALLHDIARRQ